MSLLTQNPKNRSTLSEQDPHSNPESDSNDHVEKEFSAREYRLIPVGEEKDENEGDAVDLAELFQTIRSNRKLIYRITSAFVFLGLLIVLVSPKEYESEALLMPEMRDSENGASSLLQNYGGLLGLSGLGSMDISEDGTLSPEIYPKIVQSLTFQSELMSNTIYFSDIDTTLRVQSYFEDWYSPSFFELIKEYTIQLPKKFRETRTLPNRLLELFEREQLEHVSEEELEIIKDLRERVNIELEVQTGIMTVTANLPDAAAAAQLCRATINLLTDYLKNYRTQKAKQDLEFAEEQYETGRKRFKEAQAALAEFLDQNVNLSTAKARAQEQLLQAEFDLAYNIYNNVAQKRVEARMKVQEKTPVFKVLQEVNVPLESSGVHPVVLLVLFVFVGLVVSFFVVSVKHIYFALKQKYQF